MITTPLGIDVASLAAREAAVPVICGIETLRINDITHKGANLAIAADSTAKDSAAAKDVATIQASNFDADSGKSTAVTSAAADPAADMDSQHDDNSLEGMPSLEDLSNDQNQLISSEKDISSVAADHVVGKKL